MVNKIPHQENSFLSQGIKGMVTSPPASWSKGKEKGALGRYGEWWQKGKEEGDPRHVNFYLLLRFCYY